MTADTCSDKLRFALALGLSDINSLEGKQTIKTGKDFKLLATNCQKEVANVERAFLLVNQREIFKTNQEASQTIALEASQDIGILKQMEKDLLKLMQGQISKTIKGEEQKRRLVNEQKNSEFKKGQHLLQSFRLSIEEFRGFWIQMSNFFEEVRLTENQSK